MYSASFPARVSSRFGPTVPLEPAGPSSPSPWSLFASSRSSRRRPRPRRAPPPPSRSPRDHERRQQREGDEDRGGDRLVVSASSTAGIRAGSRRGRVHRQDHVPGRRRFGLPAGVRALGVLPGARAESSNDQPREAPRRKSPGGLTRRQREILRLVAEGHSNAALARKLWVTEQTVKFHLSNVYRKLEVTNRTEASRSAQGNGLLTEVGVGFQRSPCAEALGHRADGEVPRSNVYRKLEVTNRTEASRWAQLNGRSATKSASRSARPRTLLRRRAPSRCRGRSLGPGRSTAPGRDCLALLPPGPDAVRRLPVRGTWPSTLAPEAHLSSTTPSEGDSAPLKRIAGSGNR
jgi:DNA-binding CsgD family transcriptional regulator